jgi:hypothetical protein
MATTYSDMFSVTVLWMWVYVQIFGSFAYLRHEELSCEGFNTSDGITILQCISAASQKALRNVVIEDSIKILDSEIIKRLFHVPVGLVCNVAVSTLNWL